MSDSPSKPKNGSGAYSPGRDADEPEQSVQEPARDAQEPEQNVQEPARDAQEPEQNVQERARDAPKPQRAADGHSETHAGTGRLAAGSLDALDHLNGHAVDGDKHADEDGLFEGEHDHFDPVILGSALTAARRGLKSEVEKLVAVLPEAEVYIPLSEDLPEAEEGERVEWEGELTFRPHMILGGDQSIFAVAYSDPQLVEYMANAMSWDTSGEELKLICVPAHVAFELSQLTLDGFHLLVQIVLTLALFHLLFHAPADALFHLKQVGFGFHQPNQLLCAIHHIKNFQNGLFLRQIQRHVRSYGIRQPPGIFNAGQRCQYFGRYFFTEVDIILKAADQCLHQGFRLSMLGRNQLHRCCNRLEITVGFLNVSNPGPLLTLHQYFDGAVGQFEYLQDLRYGSYLVKVLGARFINRGLLLRHKEYLLVIGHCAFKRGDGFFSSYKQGNDHVGVYHHIAEGKQWKGDRTGGFCVHHEPS